MTEADRASPHDLRSAPSIVPSNLQCLQEPLCHLMSLSSRQRQTFLHSISNLNKAENLLHWSSKQMITHTQKGLHKTGNIKREVTARRQAACMMTQHWTGHQHVRLQRMHLNVLYKMKVQNVGENSIKAKQHCRGPCQQQKTEIWYKVQK